MKNRKRCEELCELQWMEPNLEKDHSHLLPIHNLKYSY